MVEIVFGAVPIARTSAEEVALVAPVRVAVAEDRHSECRMACFVAHTGHIERMHFVAAVPWRSFAGAVVAFELAALLGAQQADIPPEFVHNKPVAADIEDLHFAVPVAVVVAVAAGAVLVA